MKYFLFIIFIITLQSCVSKKKTFWCGDHPCANKAEQQSYFKKNLTVEVKQKYITQKEEASKVEKIITQTTKINKKQVAKLEKMERKRLLTEEKELIKLSKIKNKKNAKWKKNNLKEKNIQVEDSNQNDIMTNEVVKVSTINENDKKKIQPKSKKNIKIKVSDSKDFKDKTLNSDFQKLADIIEKRNKLKSYPNINDIPRNYE